MPEPGEPKKEEQKQELTEVDVRNMTDANLRDYFQQCEEILKWDEGREADLTDEEKEKIVADSVDRVKAVREKSMIEAEIERRKL